ncbi:MAG: hypothetical protein NZ553_09300 [Caldilinea sp.]|nr:hypothetical protein [Caldilinea sp.]MDW8440655.1 hypothetical protein [Caldilineaceae bacterium]
MAGLAAHLVDIAGLDLAKQRTLLELRLRLLRRQFEREPGRIVGFVLLLVFVGPFVLLMAIGTGVAYRLAPQPWPAQLLAGVLVALWLAWIALPLLAFRTNEGLDLSRLLLYPLRTRDLVASALIGTLFDIPSYLTLPFFIAVFVGWSGQPLLYIVIAPALLIAYVLMMVSGQLVLTAGAGLLRSRRFRDLVIVFFSLLGSSCYFINRVIEGWIRAVDAADLQRLQPLLFLRWLPPGACAQAIASAAQGAWGEVLLWLAYAVGWLALLLWMWWKLLLRMTTGAAAWVPSIFEAKKPQRRPQSLSERIAAFVNTWLPAPATATATKELKLIWRVPQRRIGLLQSVVAPFVLMLAVFVGDIEALGRLPEWTALALPGVMLFSTWGLSTNMLGIESKGLATLLLTPAPRWQIFAGKGLAYLFTALLPTAVYAGILAVTSRSAFIVYGLIAAVAMALIVTAVNTVAAPYVTYPFDENSPTRQHAGGKWLTGVAQVLGVPLAIFIVSGPATAPLMLGVWWNRPEVAGVGVLIGLAYAAGVCGVAIRWAGAQLTRREPEVLEAARAIDF